MMTYYDILKAVATGQMTPDMSHYDRLHADAIRKHMEAWNEEEKANGSSQKEIELQKGAIV